MSPEVLKKITKQERKSQSCSIIDEGKELTRNGEKEERFGTIPAKLEDLMNSIKNWIQRGLSRRNFIILGALGICRFISKPLAWAKADYQRLKEFPVRSIEETQKVDLNTWRLKIEGLVNQPVSLSFEEIKALPQKAETKNFLCVEGWGLESQKWEGVHLSEVFSRLKINPKAKFITFHAAGGQYKDSLSLKEALEPDTMLAYRLNGENLSADHGFPLRLIIPRMYGYKGVKWVDRIVFTEKQEIGYWEKGGYPVDGSIPGLRN